MLIISFVIMFRIFGELSVKFDLMIRMFVLKKVNRGRIRKFD